MVSAIIVAAGMGFRMGGTLRKQYIPLSGIPIIGHTLKAVDECHEIHRMLLVIPKGDSEFCRQNVLNLLNLRNEVALIEGGDERSDSVWNGLKAVDQKTNVVVIHDGVRPFIRSDQIKACIAEARASGACILGIPAYDTLKQLDRSGSVERTLERENIRLAQTPQAFQYPLILKAYQKGRQDGFVGIDDAQMIERMGKSVKVIRGSRCNIKITEKEDLQLAESFLKL